MALPGTVSEDNLPTLLRDETSSGARIVGREIEESILESGLPELPSPKGTQDCVSVKGVRKHSSTSSGSIRSTNVRRPTMFRRRFSFTARVGSVSEMARGMREYVDEEAADATLLFTSMHPVTAVLRTTFGRLMFGFVCFSQVCFNAVLLLSWVRIFRGSSAAGNISMSVRYGELRGIAARQCNPFGGVLDASEGKGDNCSLDEEQSS